jgi:hypothetical protein
MELGRVAVQGQPRQKVHKLGVAVHTCHPSYSGSITRRIIIQADPDIKQHPISKIRAGGMVQMVKHLSSTNQTNG